jgi:glutaredoxin
MKALLAIALLLLPIAADAQTNVYRWVDKDGKVHFSDSPPPPEVKTATQKRMGGGGIDASSLPYATQVAMQKYPVTMFTGKDCGDPCSRGRDLLSKRGIPFTERDAQGKEADAAALKALMGTLDVPVLVVGDAKTKGYEADVWNSALDTAGYPRTALPQRQGAQAPAPPAAPPEQEPPK